MEYKQTVHCDKVVTHFIASCLKCDNDDINIHEYEDRYGFISKATCKKCKSSIKVNASEVGAIREWNKQNDISTLITNKTQLIEITKTEIEELRIKEKMRKK